MNRFLQFITILLISISWGCSDDFSHHFQNYEDNGKIMLSGSINQENITRADENGFADGDVISVYIVDYEGNNPGNLLDRGNRADNVKHTFDEKASRWNSSYDIYWKDKHTPVDIYGYYPSGLPEHVKNYAFSIKTDQSITQLYTLRYQHEQ